MSDTAFRTQNPSTIYSMRPQTDWGAIWAGAFTFAAIWSIFEVLGLAIFGSASTQAATVGTGISVGMSIWTIVLTIIAMYVAGLETGRLARVTTRHDGFIHGIVMFGLAVVSTIVLTSVAGGLWGAGATVRTGYLMSFTTGGEWVEFLALFLGWLAAMGGASTGVARISADTRQETQPPIQMRPAA